MTLVAALVIGVLMGAVVIYFVTRPKPVQPKPVDDAEAVGQIVTVTAPITPAPTVGQNPPNTTTEEIYERMFGMSPEMRAYRDAVVANQPARDWSYKDSKVLRWDGNWLLASGKAGQSVTYDYETDRPAKVSVAKQEGGSEWNFWIDDIPQRGFADSGDILLPVGKHTFTIRFVSDGAASVSGQYL